MTRSAGPLGAVVSVADLATLVASSLADSSGGPPPQVSASTTIDGRDMDPIMTWTGTRIDVPFTALPMSPFDLTRYRAAIFDLDGTLVHSEHVWEKAKIEVTARYGKRPSRELLDAHVGRGLKDFLDEADLAQLRASGVIA